MIFKTAMLEGLDMLHQKETALGGKGNYIFLLSQHLYE